MDTPQNGIGPALAGRFRTDLKSKTKLLSAAQRCLEDERCYRFFGMLASISELPDDDRAGYLQEITSTGDYDADELAALKRLLMDGGAAAFKHLVDVVRDIRVQQEIERILLRQRPLHVIHLTLQVKNSF